MNEAITAYGNHTTLVVNDNDVRVGMFTRTMAMLDAAIMINDIERAIHIVRTVKDHINVEKDTSADNIVVELYRLLDFMELKLSQPMPNKEKLRELAQTLQF
jgi:hypothetical protein